MELKQDGRLQIAMHFPDGEVQSALKGMKLPGYQAVVAIMQHAKNACTGDTLRGLTEKFWHFHVSSRIRMVIFGVEVSLSI